MRTGRNRRADRVVDEHRADGVALPKQQERQGGADALRVGELRETGGLPPATCGRAGPVHRPARVEDDRGTQVRLFFELLDDPAVRPCGDPPIEVPQIVARLVRPVLGEFSREAAPRRAVETREEAVNDPSRDDFEVAEAGEGGWIGEIRAERRHGANA